VYTYVNHFRAPHLPRKHGSEAALRDEYAVKNFIAPLLTHVLIHGVKKWDEVVKSFNGKAKASASSSSERSCTVVSDEAEEAAAQRADECCKADSAFPFDVEGSDDESEPRPNVKLLQAMTTEGMVAAIERSLEPPDAPTDATPMDATPTSTPTDAAPTTTPSAPATTPMTAPATAPTTAPATAPTTAPALRTFKNKSQIERELNLAGIITLGEAYGVPGPWPSNKKGAIAKLITAKPEVLAGKIDRSAEQHICMNLHRLNQLFFYILREWDGERFEWGGHHLRREVIGMAREKHGKVTDPVYLGLAAPANGASPHWLAQVSSYLDNSPDGNPLRQSCRAAYYKTDAAVARRLVVRACQASSYFQGLWEYVDVTVRLVTEPYVRWAQGDWVPFLRSLPPLSALVAASGKPVVSKVMLMQWERLLLYAEEHPDVLQHLSANCSLTDEEFVEALNALIGRYMPPRIKDLNITHYERLSCILPAIRLLREQMKAFALRRKSDESELMRLIRLYNTASWAATHTAFGTMLKDLFKKALSGGAEIDALWPLRDRYREGFDHLRGESVKALEKFIADQKKIVDQDRKDQAAFNQSPDGHFQEKYDSDPSWRSAEDKAFASKHGLDLEDVPLDSHEYGAWLEDQGWLPRNPPGGRGLFLASILKWGAESQKRPQFPGDEVGFTGVLPKRHKRWRKRKAAPPSSASSSASSSSSSSSSATSSSSASSSASSSSSATSSSSSSSSSSSAASPAASPSPGR